MVGKPGPTLRRPTGPCLTSCRHGRPRGDRLSTPTRPLPGRIVWITTGTPVVMSLHSLRVGGKNQNLSFPIQGRNHLGEEEVSSGERGRSSIL